MPEIWRILDKMEPPIPEIMHLLYNEDGEPSPITVNQIGEKVNLSYQRVLTRESKAIRYLRYPYIQRQYMVENPSTVKELENFSTKELLNELLRRENDLCP